MYSTYTLGFRTATQQLHESSFTHIQRSNDVTSMSIGAPPGCASLLLSSYLPLPSFVTFALVGVFAYFLVIIMFWDPLGSHHEKAMYYCKINVVDLDNPPGSGVFGIRWRNAYRLGWVEHSFMYGHPRIHVVPSGFGSLRLMRVLDCANWFASDVFGELNLKKRRGDNSCTACIPIEEC